MFKLDELSLEMNFGAPGVYSVGLIECDDFVKSFCGALYDVAARVFDKKDLFRVIRSALPQDPPLSDFSDNWDGLSDSLWGGLFGSGYSRILIVFRSIDGFKNKNPEDFEIFVQVLESLAKELSDSELMQKNPLYLTVLLVHSEHP